jgi:AraC-like DNA-binding protein
VERVHAIALGQSAELAFCDKSASIRRPRARCPEKQIRSLATIHSWTGLPVVADGAVRTQPLHGLLPVLAKFGLSIGDLLEEAGMPQDLLADPENTVQLSDAARLLALCATRTKCPHLGLLAGQQVSFDSMGPIGLLAQWAGSVGSALRGLILTLHLHDRAIIPTLSVSGGTAMLSLAPHRYLAVGGDQVGDFTLAVAFNLVCSLCGSTEVASEVHLAHHAPPDKRPYDRFFGHSVAFECDRNALVFPAAWLAHRLIPAGTNGRDQLKLIVAEALGRFQIDLPTKARRAIMMSIMGGDASVRSVASLIGVHPRALNRQLAAHGTTCRDLLREVRVQIAHQLLADTALPMAEIAESLGYADKTSFIRAFRRRSGIPPSAWRRTRAAG